LSFDAPHTAIAFDAAYLDLPIVQNERSVKDFLRTAPESILVKYKNGSSLTARIRRRCGSCCRAKCRISRRSPVNST
jgi:hypothetical protein